MTEIKPLETLYNGYRFRSRLEARWAVFFDVGHIKYEYEPEGFKNPNGERYLPDFYLPGFDLYVEVKPDRAGTFKEITKAKNAIYWGGPIKRILILGNIPTGYDGGIWHFPLLYWNGTRDCVDVTWWYFYEAYAEKTAPYVLELHGDIPRMMKYMPPFYIYLNGWTSGRSGVYSKERGWVRPNPTTSAVSDVVLHREFDKSYMPVGDNSIDNELLFDALTTARQARFEHGETPTVK